MVRCDWNYNKAKRDEYEKKKKWFVNHLVWLKSLQKYMSNKFWNKSIGVMIQWLVIRTSYEVFSSNHPTKWYGSGGKRWLVERDNYHLGRRHKRDLYIGFSNSQYCDLSFENLRMFCMSFLQSTIVNWLTAIQVTIICGQHLMLDVTRN